MIMILAILISFTIQFQDRINDVPWHYSDIRSASITITSTNTRFTVEVDRLFQNFSGPIYIFAETDNNRNTGWDNTGYISEDDFPLDGADLMIVINHIQPARSAIYTLNSSGSYSYLSTLNPLVKRVNDSIVTINFSLHRSILSNIYKIKFFISEEGNLGDALPDNGLIEIDFRLSVLD